MPEVALVSGGTRRCGGCSGGCETALNPSLGYKGKIGVGSKHGRTSICSSLGEVYSLGLSYAVASLVQTAEECGLLLIQFEHEWLGLQRRRRIWKPYYLCTEIEVSGIA